LAVFLLYSLKFRYINLKTLRMRTLSRFLLPIILLLCSLQLFIGISGKDLQEWDESRNGVNAYEMIQKGDYIHLYYGNELDTWNAKLPLMAWAIIACYKIFGFNEVALRFPSAICTFIFFIVLFNIIQKHQNALKAFRCCIVLLSCKAIIGFHAGINGDFDVMLSLFLLLSSYYFLKYIHSCNSYNLYATAIFTGLAFYTKGTAGLLFLPGLFLYTIIQGKLPLLYKNKHTWFAMFLFLCIAGSWILIGIFYCPQPSQSAYGTKNPIETMLVYDTFKRLTSNDYVEGHIRDPLFFIKTLDVRLNIWNYFFYLSAVSGLFLLYKNRNELKAYSSGQS
jgi:4-amino-4-deoxy-L-arabinose transferase-like glycosyltransferase